MPKPDPTPARHHPRRPGATDDPNTANSSDEGAVTELSPGVRRKLELFRERRAAVAAARTAFEERRRIGLKARHRAKLAWLAERAATDATEEVNAIADESEELNNDAA
jgi:hypothetical protein